MAIIDPSDEQAKELANDPYQPPLSAIDNEKRHTQYDGKIYDAFAIAIATLFGSILVAGLLIAANFDKVGEKSKAFATVAITIVLTICALFLSLFTNYHSALFYLSINFLLALLVFPVTVLIQGKIIQRHEMMEMQFHSYFRAIIVGVVYMIGLGLILATAIRLFLSFG